ncbi:hypothetical protein BaRGS_00032980, partial [Batillaria attramentaria]
RIRQVRSKRECVRSMCECAKFDPRANVESSVEKRMRQVRSKRGGVILHGAICLTTANRPPRRWDTGNEAASLVSNDDSTVERLPSHKHQHTDTTIATADTATASPVNDLVVTTDVATASPVNDLVVTTDVATASPVNDLVVTTDAATASPVNDLVVTTDAATASPVNDLVVTTDVATASPVNDLVVTTDVATASPVNDLVVTTDVATASPVNDLVVTTDVATASPVNDLVVTTDVATASPVDDLVVTSDVATASPVNDLVVTTDVATASPVNDLVVTSDVATASPLDDLVQLVTVGTSTSDVNNSQEQLAAQAPETELTTVKHVDSSSSDRGSESESESFHQVATLPRHVTTGVAPGNQVNVGEMTIHIHVASVSGEQAATSTSENLSPSGNGLEGAGRSRSVPGAVIDHVGTLNIHHHAHHMPADWQGDTNVLIARVDWEAERERAWSETLEVERRQADDRERRLRRKLEREKRKAVKRMKSLADSYIREWGEDVVEREEERARDHQQFMDHLTEVQRSAEEGLSNLQSQLREEREREEQRLAAMMEQHENEKRRQQEQVMTFVLRVEGQVRQLHARVAAHVDGRRLQTVVQRLFDEFNVRFLGVDCGLQFILDAPVAQWVNVVERHLLEIQNLLSDLIPEDAREGVTWAEVTQCGQNVRDIDLHVGRELPETVTSKLQCDPLSEMPSVEHTVGNKGVEPRPP